MKANRLTKPNITKVDAVPAGANQGAAIMLYKSKTGEMAKQIADTVNTSLAKGDAKTVAQTFDAKIAEATIRQRISDNWWRYTDTLRESVFSIMLDPKQDDASRKALLEKTFQEFSKLMIPALTAPATAVAKKGAKVSADRMAGLMRAHQELAGIIKEGCGSTTAMRAHLDKIDGIEDEDDDDDEGDASKARPDNDDNEEDIEDMKIDKSKLSTEEAAQLDALVAKAAIDNTGDIDPAPAAGTTTDPAVTKALEDANKTLAATTAAVAKMQDDMAIRELELVCKKYEPIPGIKPEDIAKTVHELRKAKQDDAATNYLKQMDATLDVVTKSGVFQEHGATGNGGTQNPEQMIETAALEIVKSQNVTLTKARKLAWEQHPELVKEYEASRAK